MNGPGGPTRDNRQTLVAAMTGCPQSLRPDANHVGGATRTRPKTMYLERPTLHPAPRRRGCAARASEPRGRGGIAQSKSHSERVAPSGCLLTHRLPAIESTSGTWRLRRVVEPGGVHGLAEHAVRTACRCAREVQLPRASAWIDGDEGRGRQEAKLPCRRDDNEQTDDDVSKPEVITTGPLGSRRGTSSAKQVGTRKCATPADMTKRPTPVATTFTKGSSSKRLLQLAEPPSRQVAPGPRSTRQSTRAAR